MRSYGSVLGLVVLIVASVVSFAQTPAALSTSAASIPRLIRFAGVARNADGTARAGVVGVTFLLYTDQTTGTPLWQEVQNVAVDAGGHYSVMLGANSKDGLPAELFTSNEARWLGVQVEQGAEQPRVLLVSVPYALKAGDAETLGGRPLSSFVLNEAASTGATSTGSVSSSSPTNKAGTTPAVGSQTVTTNGGTAGYIPKWLDGVTLSGTSTIFDDGSNVGIGTAAPGAKLDISGGFSVARFGGNSTDAVMTFRNTAAGGSSWDMVATATGSSAGAGNFSIAKSGVAHYFTIDTNGNVGISNTSPVAKLDINGGFSVARFGGNSTDAVMTFQNVAAGGSSWDIVATATGSSAGAGKFSIAKSGVAHYFTIDTNGNVGISNTSPGQKLSVAGTIESTSGGFKFPDGSTLTSAVNNFMQTSYTSSTTDQVVHATQNGAGAGSLTLATLPTAIRGDSSTTTDYTSGILGTSSSGSGFGVVGENFAATGYAIGVFGVSTQSANATGVWGEAEGTGTNAVGVYGKSPSTAGTGVLGYASATTGDAAGVYGRSDSILGMGVWGDSTATSGNTFGVMGRVASGSGAAGVFDNTAAGNILLGRTGTSVPVNVFRVDGSGKGYFNNGTQLGGADFAESFAVVGTKSTYEPGDLLIIDQSKDRRLALSYEPYSTLVAGIYSTKPGVLATPHDITSTQVDVEVPLAVVGIVPCKASAENGRIHRGDLLVSSSIAGHVMKGTERSRMLGAVVGKALSNLDSGTGMIQVLVTLQ